MKKSKLLTKIRLNNRLVIFVISFAAIAAASLLAIHAASPNVSIEPENGVTSNGITIGVDGQASNGRYVKFNAPAGTVYYVDCNGSDTNNGTSPATAWKTLTKANQATLQPGDGLLLKRGCTWNQQLTAKWVGTVSRPITIDAYGSGSLPLIQRDATGTNKNVIVVDVTGSYQDIKNLATAVINPFRDTTCLQSDGTGVPHGWYPGFALSGAYNTLSYLDVTLASSGVAMNIAADHNKIMHSHFHNLHYLWSLDPSLGALGAIGVTLWGDYNEIGYNLMDSNGASCTLTAGGVAQIYNAPFEVYNANHNYVHHNQAFNHIKHFEMGHDVGKTTDDNVLAYNLFASDQPCAIGPNLHGVGSSFGPIRNTLIYHNTIVFYGPEPTSCPAQQTGQTNGSMAIICDCTSDQVGNTIVEDNIFIAELKAGFYKGQITEDHNLYWDYKTTQPTDPQADPLVQFVSPINQSGLGSGSIMLNPIFVNSQTDFHLQAGSPAINRGSGINSADPLLNSILSTDLDGKSVPLGGIADIGAFEH